MLCPACRYENLPGADCCAECETDLTGLDDAQLGPIESALNQVRLRELIHREPLTVSSTDPVASVVKQMAERGRNCALVVYDGVLVGIFTERDALQKVAACYDEVAGQPIREFMTAAPEALNGDDCLAYAINKMSVGGYRHVPITDDDEKPLGVVAVRDVLSCLIKTAPELISRS